VFDLCFLDGERDAGEATAQFGDLFEFVGRPDPLRELKFLFG
jgi:hypothetical protein